MCGVESQFSFLNFHFLILALNHLFDTPTPCHHEQEPGQGTLPARRFTAAPLHLGEKNNWGNVLCSHYTSEVGQCPERVVKQAGMPLVGNTLIILVPLFPKDTFLCVIVLKLWHVHVTLHGNHI